MDPPAANADLTGALSEFAFNLKRWSLPMTSRPDYGQVYGDRGHGLRYGWSCDHTTQTRLRTAAQPNSTLCHFLDGQSWDIALSHGSYALAISVGDVDFGSRNTLRVEGKAICEDLDLNQATRVLTGQTTVTDGRLTLDAGGSTGRQTKINFVEIRRLNH